MFWKAKKWKISGMVHYPATERCNVTFDTSNSLESKRVFSKTKQIKRKEKLSM